MTLLTMYRLAKRLGVSLAAVRAWQRDGLLHQVQCAFCLPDASRRPSAAKRLAGVAA